MSLRPPLCCAPASAGMPCRSSPASCGRPNRRAEPRLVVGRSPAASLVLGPARTPNADVAAVEQTQVIEDFAVLYAVDPADQLLDGVYQLFLLAADEFGHEVVAAGRGDDVVDS